MASCSSATAKRGDTVLGHCEDELGKGEVWSAEAWRVGNGHSDGTAVSSFAMAEISSAEAERRR